MAELSKRGLITAVVCSDPFIKLAQTQARTFGVPELPLLRIPHPLGGISVEKVEGRADIALPKLLALVREHTE
jgi:hypothetical protein